FGDQDVDRQQDGADAVDGVSDAVDVARIVEPAAAFAGGRRAIGRRLVGHGDAPSAPATSDLTLSIPKNSATQPSAVRQSGMVQASGASRMPAAAVASPARG